VNPTDARLFPDFAAVPTARERRSSRTYWRSAQVDLFATPAELVTQALADALACPVCAGDHAGPCQLGEAPALFDDEHQADEPSSYVLSGHITRVHRLARGERVPFRPASVYSWGA
jgi:hypothetical protein